MSKIVQRITTLENILKPEQPDEKEMEKVRLNNNKKLHQNFWFTSLIVLIYSLILIGTTTFISPIHIVKWKHKTDYKEITIHQTLAGTYLSGEYIIIKDGNINIKLHAYKSFNEDLDGYNLTELQKMINERKTNKIEEFGIILHFDF